MKDVQAPDERQIFNPGFILISKCMSMQTDFRPTNGQRYFAVYLFRSFKKFLENRSSVTVIRTDSRIREPNSVSILGVHNTAFGKGMKAFHFLLAMG